MLRMMDATDIEAVRRIGEQGVQCMRFMEKWLRKKPPIAPRDPVLVDPVEEAELPAGEEDPAGEQEPVGEQAGVGEEEVHPQELPAGEEDPAGEQAGVGEEEVHPQEVHDGPVQQAEGMCGSFESLESFPITPLLESMTPLSNQVAYNSNIPIDPSWFESAVDTVEGAQTNFVDVPVLKKRKRLDGDGGETQSRADLFGLHGHRSEEVQVEGEGVDGVVTQKDTQVKPLEAHDGLHAEPIQEMQEEAQMEGQGDGAITQVDMLPRFVFEDEDEDEDPSPSLAQRRARRDPHLPGCGTGSCLGR